MNLLQSIIQFFIRLFSRSKEPKVTTNIEPEQTINVSSVQDSIPEIIMGDSIVENKSAEIGPVEKGPNLHTINNSKNHPYYTQRNNEINPGQACNVTSMTMGLLYNGLIHKKGARWYNTKEKDIYELNKDSLPEIPYAQFEDNLIYFLQHDSRVLNYYNKTYPNLYNDWVNERDGAKSKGMNLNRYAYKSYPPNELHLVLSYGISLFIGLENATQYCTLDLEDIVARIKKGESLVVSGVFEGLNHIVCIVGLQYDMDTDEITGFLIDDPYYRTLNYKSKKTGDDSFISKDDFIACVKPVNSNKKACHTFKR